MANFIFEGCPPEPLPLVMQQAGVSKGKAVKALRKSKEEGTKGEDIVSAIMELTITRASPSRFPAMPCFSWRRASPWRTMIASCDPFH